MIRIKFELTDLQVHGLAPLFEAARKAREKGTSSKGMVLLRLDGQRSSEAVFLPHRYAAKIRKVMDAFKEEAGS